MSGSAKQPVFVPRRFSHRTKCAKCTGSHFKQREIKFNPVPVVNNTISKATSSPYRKSVVVPASQIPVCVEVHPAPQPTMTVYSIFGSKRSRHSSLNSSASNCSSSNNNSQLEPIEEEAKHVQITVEDTERSTASNLDISTCSTSKNVDSDIIDIEGSNLDANCPSSRTKRRKSSLLSLDMFKSRVGDKFVSIACVVHMNSTNCVTCRTRNGHRALRSTFHRISCPVVNQLRHGCRSAPRPTTASCA